MDILTFSIALWATVKFNNNQHIYMWDDLVHFYQVEQITYIVYTSISTYKYIMCDFDFHSMKSMYWKWDLVSLILWWIS